MKSCQKRVKNCISYSLLSTFVFMLIALSAISQNSASNPFTSLGSARSVTTAGTYYFNIGGVTFDTYVDGSGYILIATDVKNTSGVLTQSTSVSISSDRILNATILALMTTSRINQIRMTSTVANTLDAVSANATLIGRMT